jgi:hypothetical protein
VTSPGHTASQQHLVEQIRQVIAWIKQDDAQILRDTVVLVRLNINQLRPQETLSLLDEIARLATEVQAGGSMLSLVRRWEEVSG